MLSAIGTTIDDAFNKFGIETHKLTRVSHDPIF